MTDRIGSKGAIQHAIANYASASSSSRIGGAGAIHGAYSEYAAWKAANPGVQPNRLGAKGSIFGAFKDGGL